MNNKNYASITILIATILIPQLFFWWLAPQSADAYWSVYACGTCLILIIPAMCYAAYLNSNIRESAGLMLIAGALELTTIISAIVILALNLSLRTSLFVFAIILVFGLMAVVPAIHSIYKNRFGHGYTNLPTIDYRYMNPAEDFEIPLENIPVNRNANRPMNHTNRNRPLPPRY